ncbi:exosortase-dependent surface protein XDP1 [Aromatoleum bremense]|uniref:PEP-CTERM sorting domain-containing protein n=1 Tax=Aromatoleum bremense TaxID=76115 RepID=A0ABX1NZQ4_9RHOO|nr:exosortase-dependent surface protein XDP1 [Aromatoleum bremense]NMG17545.1 PEP-CTERM sorting domain-containing protein [Aromatoleum bremense]QTQ31719.1 PEP-CTERM protein-sorting domain-containing protein [Aromatoleum bremense]
MSCKQFIAAGAVIGTLVSATAHASMVWSLGSSNGGSASTWVTQRNYSTGGVDLAATAWANTGGADGGAGAVPADQQTIQSAYLGWWSGNGLGVGNADAGTASSKDQNEGNNPEHATDNNQRYDSILLSFTEAVKLETLKLGWFNTDSDVSVLAYTGSASPLPLAGLKYQSLTSNGWSLIGHHSNVGSTDPVSINAAGIVSSFWLIGAFNPLVGAAQSWTVGNDYVKLAAVSGSTVPTPPAGVPEPGSLTLAALALGLIALTGSRRPGALDFGPLNRTA